MAWMRLFAGRDDQAVEQCLRNLERNDGYPLARVILGCAYAQQGRFEPAITELEMSRSQGAGDPAVGALGYRYRWRAKRRRPGLHRMDEAFQFLEKAVVDPRFGSLRPDRPS